MLRWRVGSKCNSRITSVMWYRRKRHLGSLHRVWSLDGYRTTGVTAQDRCVIYEVGQQHAHAVAITLPRFGCDNHVDHGDDYADTANQHGEDVDPIRNKRQSSQNTNDQHDPYEPEHDPNWRPSPATSTRDEDEHNLDDDDDDEWIHRKIDVVVERIKCIHTRLLWVMQGYSASQIRGVGRPTKLGVDRLD